MARYFMGGDGTLLVERRANPRFDVEMPVRASPAAGGDPMDGMTVNISESGAQLLLAGAVPAGAYLNLEVDRFRWTGQVVWSRAETSGARVGLRFTWLGAKDRDGLLELIEHIKRGKASDAGDSNGRSGGA